MPTDSLRSRIYKSLLTCKNKKCIVDKNTVKIKKAASSRMEKRFKSQAARKNFSNFSESKLRREETAIREVVDEFSSSSSCQLMEVSRGARKLNRTIDLWSNGMKYDCHYEEIARDLFEGAIDLQQSLVILGKLQEASKTKKNTQIERTTTGNELFFYDNRESELHPTIYSGAPTSISRFRLEKQQEILKLRSLVGVEPDTSKEAYLGNFRSLPTKLRVGDTGNELCKRRLSADYSNGDGAEELKKAIRDRLARQMFPKTTNMAESSSMENSGSDYASTSSSQSSIGNNAAIPAKNGNGRNLIAKLMGLELQPKQMHETLDKQFPDPRRPKFSTEMNKATKPKSVKHEITKRTSESNHDNQQFKGSFKHSAKEVDDNFNYSSNRNSREKFSHTARPPIVLLKPLRVSQVEWDKRQAQVFEEDEALNKKRFMKLKMKEKQHQQNNDSNRTLGNHKKEAQNSKEHNCKPKECINSSSKSSPLSTNQTIVEKVIDEVSIQKLEAINFGGKSNVKKADQTYSSTSLLNMKEKAGSSRHQTCEYCSERQSSLIHTSCKTESSKSIDHEISLIKPEIIPKAPISIDPPPSSHTNELFDLNANGSSRIWISPEESPPIVSYSMESLRNNRKIATNGILGLKWWWWPIQESMNEAEEIVEYLEERILVELIQEVFV